MLIRFELKIAYLVTVVLKTGVGQ